uniref:Glucose-methanol-choline oxidoreductase N-terminal domain-containing protein n=2 Tax=Anopheles atroparvus TaxID=41427 RepID=A0A182JK90_ANOAO
MEALLNGQCASQSLGPANQLFALLVQTILAAQCTISPPDMWPKDYGPTALAQGLEEYDFVIVGAGSAGSVVANRLSENPAWKVLLLEAGGDPPIESEIPFLFFTLQRTSVDWSYYAGSRKARACRASPRGCYWPRGKMLGGSGAMNVMIYMRGNARDYDDWKKRGNVGWGWESVLRYFKKSEDNRDPQVVQNGTYHGTGGYLTVVTSTGDPAGVKRMQAAFLEAGFKWLTDFNGNTHIGFGRIQQTIVNGTRFSPAKAFLVPAKQRPNLQVIKHALATKIEFDTAKRVSSVQFSVNNGEPQYVKVRKEAIVSAGAINTPQLLMLSGIGRTKDLREHNIPMVSELPVGRKMQDHVAVPLFFKLFKPIAPEYTLETSFFQYLAERDSPLSQFAMAGINGFANTVDRFDPYPNVQYQYLYSPKRAPNLNNNFLMATELNYTLGDVIAMANSEADLLTSVPVLLKPKSWGSVKLRSANAQDKPYIESGYLYHPDDLRISSMTLSL